MISKESLDSHNKDGWKGGKPRLLVAILCHDNSVRCSSYDEEQLGGTTSGIRYTPLLVGLFSILTTHTLIQMYIHFYTDLGTAVVINIRLTT